MAEDDTGEPTLSRREFLGSGSQAAAFTLLSTQTTSLPSSQPPEDRIGVAVVGLGNFAQYVLPRLRGAKHVRVAALVSGTPDSARRLAAQQGVPENRIYTYDSFDRLAEARDVHAVYIALPVGLHAEYALRALRLGKHVLTEKTMAASVEQGRAMVAAARSAGRVLMVAYRARFDTYNQAAMRMAQQRELGEVVAITAHKGFALGNAVGQRGWRTQRSLAGGGTLVDIGIYSVQAARYLAGEEPVEVTAISRSTTGDPRFREVEEDIVWSLRFPGGALASCSASWRYALQNRYRVACTEGWFELEPATSNGNLRLRVGRGNRGDVIEERMLPQVDQIPLMFDHFAECVREGKAPLTPGEEGLRDLEVIAAIYEAAASGRTVRLAGG